MSHKRGGRCKVSHSSRLSSFLPCIHRNRSFVICLMQYYNNDGTGYCPRGQSCWFFHPEDSGWSTASAFPRASGDRGLRGPSMTGSNRDSLGSNKYASWGAPRPASGSVPGHTENVEQDWGDPDWNVGASGGSPQAASLWSANTKSDTGGATKWESAGTWLAELDHQPGWGNETESVQANGENKAGTYISLPLFLKHVIISEIV